MNFVPVLYCKTVNLEIK